MNEISLSNVFASKLLIQWAMMTPEEARWCAANKALQFRPVPTCNRPLSSAVSRSQDKNSSLLPTSYKVILFWIQRTRCWLHKKRKQSLKSLQTCALEPIHLGLGSDPPPHIPCLLLQDCDIRRLPTPFLQAIVLCEGRLSYTGTWF